MRLPCDELSTHAARAFTRVRIIHHKAECKITAQEKTKNRISHTRKGITITGQDRTQHTHIAAGKENKLNSIYDKKYISINLLNSY